jgi:hypothetical protein
MLMGCEEMLHRLRDGELHVQEAAIAQHHNEEGEPPPGRSNIDRIVFAPIDLGALAGCKR